MRVGSRDVEAELRDFARLQVRAGLTDTATQVREVAEAVQAELPGLDADVLARAWVAAEAATLRTEQAGWAEITDHDRLRVAFTALRGRGIDVLEGVPDHWAATRHLQGSAARGVAWFTPSDVWHAIDEGMLEVNLWHASTANVAPGDALLDEAVAAFADAGLAAHFDEGRVEVGAFWRRRLAD